VRRYWYIVLFLVAVCSAWAQNPGRAAAIAGTVFDPSGAEVPDATVTLKRGPKELSSVKTDASGRFRFEGIPQGNYSIEILQEGFQPSLTPVQVQEKPPAALTITLSLAQLVSQVSVTAGAVQVSTDTAENRDSVNADQNLLENVPIFDQDYVAAMSAFLDAGSLGTNGAQLIINGVEVTSATITASAIQQVRINQNPYSAEFARPGRGNIEIITKEATSDYHGTLNFIFRDSVINARDPFALVRAPEQRRIIEGAISGPVGHSKTTSFLLSGHRQEEDLQSIVFAEGLSGPIRENVASPKRDTLISLHIGHQFSTNHSAYWQYNEWEYPSFNQGVGNFVLPEAGTNSDQWEREWIFNDRLTLSPKWLLQSQILIGWEHHATTSVTDAPKIVVQDSFTSGGAQIDLVNTERHATLNEVASWSSGKHFVKFGLNVPDWSRRGIVNHSNFGTTYFFSSLQDYAAQQPYAFRQQAGSGEVLYWQQELGGFVQDDYRVLPNLSLSLGLRYNWQNHLHDNRQFAPRIAFAYSPLKSRKTVFRGGAGVFYDRTGAGPLGDLLLYNGLTLLSYLIKNPTVPSPSLAGVPTDVVQFDPAIHEPYSIQYSFGVERQLAKQTTLAVTYNGSVGISLFRSLDVNAPLPPDYLVVPDPSVGVLRQIESSGRQVSNSLQITLRGDLPHRITGLMQYTLSRTDNNTGGITWFPANQYDLSGEWSRADFDQKHRFNLLESYSPGKSFTLGIGVTAASGKPYSLTSGGDIYGTGLTNGRPPGVPRNSLEGPAYVDLDSRLSRDFFLSRRKEKGNVLTVAFDAFNLLNHVNYVAFVGNLQSPFFGQAVSAYPARRLQITTRFKF
jgi:carboxypeptidase family protein